LRGKSELEKIDWLKKRGRLEARSELPHDQRIVYECKSAVGIWCIIFFDDDEEIVFIGDHATLTVNEAEE
jgi:hypothetical protein